MNLELSNFINGFEFEVLIDGKWKKHVFNITCYIDNTELKKKIKRKNY